MIISKAISDMVSLKFTKGADALEFIIRLNGGNHDFPIFKVEKVHHENVEFYKKIVGDENFTNLIFTFTYQDGKVDIFGMFVKEFLTEEVILKALKLAVFQ